MDMETYEEVIDAYNLSSEKRRGMSLTDYIKINNIKIKEIEMSPLEDLKKVAKKADGGFMRKGYAMGTDEDDIPEAEDMPMDEYMELLKSLGAPVKGQESGIRSIKSPIQKASMDENEELFMRLVDDLMERGFSLQEAIEEARREFEERSAQRMIPSANKMADADPMLLEEYLKYVDEMKEMGREPMSLRQFSEQARAGLKVGGLASII